MASEPNALTGNQSRLTAVGWGCDCKSLHGYDSAHSWVGSLRQSFHLELSTTSIMPGIIDLQSIKGSSALENAANKLHQA